MCLTKDAFENMTFRQIESDAENIITKLDQLLSIAAKANVGKPKTEPINIVYDVSAVNVDVRDYVCEQYNRNGWPKVTSEVVEASGENLGSTTFSFFLLI